MPDAGIDVRPPPDVAPDRPAFDVGVDVRVDGGPTALTVMTFNIQHGASATGCSTTACGLDRIAAVIREAAPDLVALNECDVGATRSSDIDEPRRLGELTGMQHVFQRSIRITGGEYGLAVLSRFPILGSERFALSSFGAEQRILLVARIARTPTDTITFAVTHLGLNSTNSTERNTQAHEVLGHLRGRERVFLAGDFNATPGSPALDILTTELTDTWVAAGTGTGYTHPASGPTHRIDYIMAGAGWRPAFGGRVPAVTVSDHRPVVVHVPL
jgi:endonuclease/exonuclease/phosphatase family metal-dependent hydrolase